MASTITVTWQVTTTNDVFKIRSFSQRTTNLTLEFRPQEAQVPLRMFLGLGLGLCLGNYCLAQKTSL